MWAGSEAWRVLLVKRPWRWAGQMRPGPYATDMGWHAQALLEWNLAINLTPITDSVKVAVKHFLDAIIPITHIPQESYDR